MAHLPSRIDRALSLFVPLLKSAQTPCVRRYEPGASGHLKLLDYEANRFPLPQNVALKVSLLYICPVFILRHLILDVTIEACLKSPKQTLVSDFMRIA